MVYQPTSRVLTVLGLLQTHGQLSAGSLAQRLEVDPRTIRRYIISLQDMGIPVEAEYGRYGGYALRPGYKLPPLMFSDEEVLVLTIGLQLARRSGLAGANAAVESALAKIGRVLPESLREQLHALQASTQPPDDERVRPTVAADILAVLSLASQQHSQVKLSYASDAGSTQRTFDPYAVIHHDEYWYTVGYCHLRNALRTFRLDRVEMAEVLPSTFAAPVNFDALDHMLNSFGAIPDRWEIEVLLKMPLDEAKRRFPRPLATLLPEGDSVRLQASMPDLYEMARKFIAAGCPLTIVKPPELRDVFLQIADEIRQMAIA